MEAFDAGGSLSCCGACHAVCAGEEWRTVGKRRIGLGDMRQVNHWGHGERCEGGDGCGEDTGRRLSAAGADQIACRTFSMSEPGGLIRMRGHGLEPE